MPIFKQDFILEAARNVKVFFEVRVGLIRGAIPTSDDPGEQARERLAAKDLEISRLRARLAGRGDVAPTDGILPENLIWMFGVARTGSSWLSEMMGELDGCAVWYEPYVGDVFGYAYYRRAGEQQREREDFILGDHYREAWIKSIRTFVLDGVNARFSGMAGYVIIKEPNGSVGAPLLVEALPESRVILLVRDPRDVVASLLAAQRKGSWGSANGEGSLADRDPGEFVRQRARMYMVSLGKAREAYEAHEGRKVVTRYEDLRSDTFGELQKIYSALGMSAEEDQLRQVVEKHSWENIPENNKGENKPRRKATPGGWQEDLTCEQARMVEEITAPIMNEFYPGWERLAATPPD